MHKRLIIDTTQLGSGTSITKQILLPVTNDKINSEFFNTFYTNYFAIFYNTDEKCYYITMYLPNTTKNNIEFVPGNLQNKPFTCYLSLQNAIFTDYVYKNANPLSDETHYDRGIHILNQFSLHINLMNIKNNFLTCRITDKLIYSEFSGYYIKDIPGVRGTNLRSSYGHYNFKFTTHYI